MELVFLCVHMCLCIYTHIIFSVLLHLEDVWDWPVCLWHVTFPILPTGVPSDDITWCPLLGLITGVGWWGLPLFLVEGCKGAECLQSTKASHCIDELNAREWVWCLAGSYHYITTHHQCSPRVAYYWPLASTLPISISILWRSFVVYGNDICQYF